MSKTSSYKASGPSNHSNKSAGKVEVPLVLELIRFVQKVVGYLCVLVSLPIWLWILLATNFGKSKAFAKASPLYVLLFIPRILMSVSTLAVLWRAFTLGSVILSLIPEEANHSWAMILAHALVVGTIVYAYSFKSGKEELNKLLPTDTDAMGEVILETFADIFHLVLFAFCLIGVVRIPAILDSLLTGKKHEKSWQQEIQANSWLTITDLITLPFLLADCIIVWRIRKVTRTVTCVNDVFWSENLRFAVYKQFFAGIGDLIGVVLALVVLCSIYRAKALISGILRETSWKRRRWVVIDQFLLLLVDILTLIPLLVVLGTLYRVPTLKRRLQNDARVSFTTGRHAVIIWEEFGTIVFIDSICIIAGVIVLLLVWRSYFLIRGLLRANNARERRRCAVENFGMLFVDILDLPVLALSLIIIVTGWRALPLWRHIEKCNSRRETRKAVIHQFLLWLLDQVCAILVLIIVLTIYRQKSLYNGLKKCWAQPSAPTAAQRKKDDDLDEDNPAPPQPSQDTEWHRCVIHEFLQLLQDIPVILLSVLSLWRFPFLIVRLRNECETAAERRRMTLRYIIYALKDIPIAVLLFIMIATLWRIPFLIATIKNYRTGDDEHQMIANEFKEWIKDVPFVACAIIPLCSWRCISFINKVYKAPTQKQRRQECAKGAFVVVLDIITTALLLIIFTTVLRIIHWFALLKFFANRDRKVLLHPDQQGLGYKTSVYYNATWEAFGELLLDIITLFFVAIVICVGAKIPKLVKWIFIFSSSKDAEYPDRVVRPRYGNTDYSFGINTYIKLAYAMAFDSIAFIPHLICLPLKVLALPCALVYMYTSVRFGKPGQYQNSSKKGERDEKPWYNTRLIIDIKNIQNDCSKCMTFYKSQTFVLLNLLLFFFVFANEMAVLFTCLNSVLIFIVTLGSPAWGPFAKKLPYVILRGIKDLLIYIQIILLPAIFAYCVLSLFLPVALFFITKYPLHVHIYDHFLLRQVDSETIRLLSLSGEVSTFLTTLVSQAYQASLPFIDLFNQYCPYYLKMYVNFWATLSIFAFTWTFKAAALVWKFVPRNTILTIMWFFVGEEALFHTRTLKEKYFEFFTPIAAAQWLLAQITALIAGRLWGAYKMLLVVPTTFCYRHRKHLFIGEILMFPLFGIWTCSSMLLPYYFGKHLLVAAIPVSLFLCWVAMDVIAYSWRDEGSSLGKTPVLVINSVTPRFQKYGMTLSINCTKPSDFVITQCRLHLVGDDFWHALSNSIGSSIITTFKYTLHPVILCDNFFPANVFKMNSNSVIIPLSFGTPSQGWLKINSQYVLKPRLEDLANKHKNPTVELVIEHGIKQTFGWRPAGVLLKVKFTIADLLNALQNESDLLIKQD